LSLFNGGADKLISAVQEANLSFFTAVPRVEEKVGPKNYYRIKE
jgi:hypothetical protein